MSKNLEIWKLHNSYCILAAETDFSGNARDLQLKGIPYKTACKQANLEVHALSSVCPGEYHNSDFKTFTTIPQNTAYNGLPNPSREVLKMYLYSRTFLANEWVDEILKTRAFGKYSCS
jgi:hypothetical protein